MTLRDASREIPLKKKCVSKVLCRGDNNRFFEQGRYILSFDTRTWNGPGNRENKGTGSGRKAQKVGIRFEKGISESGEMLAVGCGGGSKRRRKGEMIVHARISGDNLHFHSLDKPEKVQANAKRKAGGVCMYIDIEVILCVK